ncbi:MAG: aldo/keto reductase [bacterium]|nr:MAG: aldo/keto reductase [bacterium]
MDHFSRRKFIKSTVLMGAASMVGCSSTPEVDDAKIFAPPAEVSASTLVGKVPTGVLGKTGVTVPIISHGGGYELNNVMVARAFDLGINYFDVADCYLNGQSEVILGKVLEKQGKRKDAFIVTKNHPKQFKDLLVMVDQRLTSLRTDYLDLYFMHQLGDAEYPKECVDWPKSKELKEVVETLKKQKKIKFFGFSCHAGILPQAMEAAAEGGFVDAIMLRYNFREVNSDALNRAIDKAKQANIGLIAMKTQGGRVSFQEKADSFKEKGFNQAQSTLKAVWADGRMDTIVSNMPSLQIVQENAIAALQKEISQTERQMLDDYAKATNHLVCHGCDHLCSSQVNSPVRIGDTLRYLMYHDNYEEYSRAKDLFGKLPLEAREAIFTTDFKMAEAACPHNLEIGKMLHKAAHKLA